MKCSKFLCYILIVIFQINELKASSSSDIDLFDESDGNPSVYENISLSNTVPFFKSKGERFQLRVQVQKDLDVIESVAETIKDQIDEPILCLGTGRAERSLFLNHSCPTIVKEKDYCIDFKLSYRADDNFNVFDCNKLRAFKEQERSFGLIYFAHVGQFFPHDNECCSLYFQLTKPGGAFLYKSFVFFSNVHLPKLMGFPEMLQVESYYSLLFSRWGFKNIHVKEKPEPDMRDGGGVVGKSLVIYAERPLENQILVPAPSCIEQLDQNKAESYFTLESTMNTLDLEDEEDECTSLNKTIPNDEESDEERGDGACENAAAETILAKDLEDREFSSHAF